MSERTRRQPTSPVDVEVLRQAVREGRLEWRKHVLQKLAERGLAQDDVRGVLLTGEKIRDYVEDWPFPSALFLGYVGNKPLHVVASCDIPSRRAFVITAYEPSLAVFEADYRTKRN